MRKNRSHLRNIDTGVVAMKFTKLILSSLILATQLTSPALADFSTADSLYARRAEGRAIVAEARTAYLDALSSATNSADKIRAASQLGRLAIYEGDMLLTKDQTEERKPIFRQCWDSFIEKINPNTVGENGEYYFFKGMCLAFWGEAAGTLQSLPQVPNLLGAINRGQEKGFIDLEGGGINRLAAGVYSNEKARPLGIFKPEEALAAIDNALASPGIPGGTSGKNFYENWRIKGRVLVTLGRTDEARALMNDKIAEISALVDNDELPQGREPETLWVLSSLKTEVSLLNQ
jgi:tetratricopeptide (TPR) repeat protein